jgi:C4-dicarboxylate-specific signal transduction histidine kinase
MPEVMASDPRLARSYVSGSVYDDDGQLVGVVVAKICMRHLHHWVARAGGSVVNENGVIVLAQDKTLIGRALPHAAVIEMTREKRRPLYRRDRFEPLVLASASPANVSHLPWLPQSVLSDLTWFENRPLPTVVRGPPAQDAEKLVRVRHGTRRACPGVCTVCSD